METLKKILEGFGYLLMSLALIGSGIFMEIMFLWSIDALTVGSGFLGAIIIIVLMSAVMKDITRDD